MRFAVVSIRTCLKDGCNNTFKTYVEQRFCSRECASEERAKNIVLGKGRIYVRDLKLKYPRHFASHKGLNERSIKFNLDNDFPDTREGILLFVKEMGEVPNNMIQPTVGRKDHDLGYVLGNVEWQSRKDNVIESNIRRSTTCA
jgi:hypothetical protein